MAADHVADRIRVNCVLPGTASTPWIGRLLDSAANPEAQAAALNARQPIGRLVPGGGRAGDRVPGEPGGVVDGGDGVGGRRWDGAVEGVKVRQVALVTFAVWPSRAHGRT
jgi:hypothetical protein